MVSIVQKILLHSMNLRRNFASGRILSNRTFIDCEHCHSYRFYYREMNVGHFNIYIGLKLPTFGKLAATTISGRVNTGWAGVPAERRD